MTMTQRFSTLRLLAAVVFIEAVLHAPASAATITWSTTTGLWADGANWLGGTAPANDTTTDTAFFSQSNGNQTVQFSADRSITGITIANTGSTTFASDSATARLLTLGASGLTVNAGAGVVTLGTSSAPVNLAVTTGSLTNNSSNLLTIGGNISRASSDGTARTLTFTGSGNTTVTGSVFNGAGANALAVIKSGAGTLSLAGGLGSSGGLTVSGGTLAVSNNASATNVGPLNVGSSSAAPAALSITSGALVFGRTGNDSNLGFSPGQRGIMSISGSANVTLQGNNNYFNLGWDGAGVVNQTGGSATYGGGGIIFSRYGGGYGAYLLSGGTAVFSAGSLLTIGSSGVALFQQTGGSGTSATNVDIGWYTFNGTAPAIGIVDFSGGTFSTGTSAGFMQTGRYNSASPGTNPGNNAATGIVTVRNSAYVQVSGSNFLITNSSTSATGIVNLLGGTLEVNQIGKWASTSAKATLNADGGTLKVFTTNSGTGFLQGLDNAFVYSGGLKVDTNGQSVTIAQPFTAPAGYGVLASGSTVTVASGGSGYIAAPVVMFSAPSGGGVRATGLATIDANGTVTGITITSPGSGYALNESVTITYNAGSNTSGAAVSVAPSFTVNASTLNASGGFQKLGAGTLTLTGSSSYSGGTTLSTGTLVVGNANALGASTGNLTVNGGLLNLSGTSIIVGRLGGSGGQISTSSAAGTATLTTSLASGSSTFAGSIVDNGSGKVALTKGGAYSLTLSGSNGYTGATAITGGRLEIASGGGINGTSGITINGSAAELKYNSATPLTQAITFTQGTLSGTGTIGTAVTAGANDILSPGNSPGAQSFTSGLTWDPAGAYLWEMNDATGGNGTGWDIINVSGGSGLTINATSGTTFKIAITSLSGTAAGNASNFSATTSGSWTILSSANGITGFAANKFTLDRSAFTNTSSGSFTVSQVTSGPNQTLVLAYNTVSALSSSTSSVTGFRVMQNQSTTTSVNLVNAGPDATGYAISPSAAMSLGSGSTGTLAASGTQAITFGYASTAATGARSGSVSFTNTGNSGDAGGSVSVSGAVVTNRVVTASDANFGVVHLGASGTATSNFTSTGSDNDFTRITVANGSGGGLTVSGSSGFVFNGSGGSSRSVAGTFATAGALSGTISLTNASAEAAGTLPGQVPGTTSLAYSASVFSGTATWNVAGGGSWGTGSSSSWTSTGGVQAAPGTFAGYTNTDVAIFAGSQGGTSTVLLNGATPSLAALSFTNTTARYVIDQGSGGSLTLAAANGKPTIDVVAGGLHEIKTAIQGTAGLQKLGGGTLVLSGSSSYSGGTDISAGTLAVNGAISGGVNVATGATLGGSGAITGAITGAGLVSPGDSPGILTAAQLDPSGGLDAAFEFTALSPTYASASASLNDVIRLTNVSNSFASSAFTAANVIDVYFNVDSITNGQVYEGGFFTGLSAASLLAALDGTATFNYWAKTTGTPARSFGGFDYVSLTSLPGITGVTFQTSARTADFGSGSVNGSVTQFVIVPEPATLALASIGVAAAAWAARRRQRR